MRKGEVQSLSWHDVHSDAITLRAENREFQCENRRTHLNKDFCIATPLTGSYVQLHFQFTLSVSVVGMLRLPDVAVTVTV